MFPLITLTILVVVGALVLLHRNLESYTQMWKEEFNLESKVTSMCLEAVIGGVLYEQGGQGWCDTCLADQVQDAMNVEMKVQQIAEAACTLVESNGFRRTVGKCSACKQMKTITQELRGHF